MRRRLTLLVVSLVALPAGLAAARIPSTPTRSHARYVNPFTIPTWEPSRIDMGVDWVPVHRLAVVAIGDARILGSDSHSNWPGQHMVWYQLLDGSHAGDVIYVAEHLRRLAPAGRVVRAGQQIAVALPGDPWTEWGWADTDGAPRAYPCYKEGHRTNSGRGMARFMASPGASLAERPGPGPDRPTGKLC
jgi:hypothetical protein